MKLAKPLSTYRFLLFLLALCLHILIFLTFAANIVFLPPYIPDKKSPSLEIPAYAYQESNPATFEPPAPEKNEEVSKIGIKKSVKKEVKHLTQLLPTNLSKPEDPVHLIGEDHEPRPLLTLLGKALTKHLLYPKAAIDFNVRGISVIGFVVHPDGQVTDVQLVKSSGTEVLDNEAVAAASAISPVNNVGQYLKEPRYMVIGIIFG